MNESKWEVGSLVVQYFSSENLSNRFRLEKRTRKQGIIEKRQRAGIYLVNNDRKSK